MDEKELCKVFEKILDERSKTIEARLDGMDRAAVLKAEEIDRRLEEHNKLREEVLLDRSMFMRNEVYSADRKTWQQWKETVNSSVTKLMTTYENRFTLSTSIAFVSLLIALATFATLIFLKV